MSRTTRPQPAREIARRQRWTLSLLAQEIDTTFGHLASCMSGRATPSPDVRERLPQILNTPLDELFDEDLLARTYSGPKNFARSSKGGA